MDNLVTFKDKDYSKILNALSFMQGKAADWVEGFMVTEDIDEMDWKTFGTWTRSSYMLIMPVLQGRRS